MATITTAYGSRSIPYKKTLPTKLSFQKQQETVDKSYFTPIFIVIAICISIAGIVVIQFFDRLFTGSKWRNLIRMVCITIIINIILGIFLIMSFTHVKSTPGQQGPSGNKGLPGNLGADGSLSMCSNTVLKASDVRQRIRASANLDLTPPTIIM